MLVSPAGFTVAFLNAAAEYDKIGKRTYRFGVVVFSSFSRQGQEVRQYPTHLFFVMSHGEEEQKAGGKSVARRTRCTTDVTGTARRAHLAGSHKTSHTDHNHNHNHSLASNLYSGWVKTMVPKHFSTGAYF